MIRRTGILACAVALALVSPALAVDTISGTVKHVDDTGRIIELTDGRIVHLGYDIAVDDPRTAAVLVDGRPVAVSEIRPGMYIVVPSEPMVVSAPRASATAPATVVTEPTIQGTVVRVDPGTQTIVLSDGRIVQTSASTVVVVGDRTVDVATVQPGDTVVITTTDVAPGALPREAVLTAARVLIVGQPQAL